MLFEIICKVDASWLCTLTHLRATVLFLVAAIVAVAELGTRQPRVEALTIFFLAVCFFAVAAPRVVPITRQ